MSYFDQYYGQLVGAKITDFTMSEADDYGDEWPTFTMTLKNGAVVTFTLSADPEGNGAGFAFIEEAKLEGLCRNGKPIDQCTCC